MNERQRILEEARQLVGAAGTVRDYECDCGWPEAGPPEDPEERERFLVKWPVERFELCYNIRQLRKERGG